MSDISGIEPRTPAATPADLSALTARVAALEALPGASQQIYNCLAGVSVRQVVYQSAAGTVAQADASNASKMPAIGFVVTKPSSLACYLQDEDELGGFVGLTAGAAYYVDPATPGGITATQPDVLAGEIVQQVGVAKSATVLRITIATPPPVTP